MSSYCIQVQNVKKSHQPMWKKEQIVLNGLNMSVENGKIYTLIGSSGCGKSTLLGCIMGMHKINSGEIKIFNQRVKFDKSFKHSNLIGYMPQDISLVPQLTVYETLQFFGNLQMLDKKTFLERFALISELLKLPQKDSFIENLSGGEQRRVSFAATIIHNPKLLILDEPTVGLDLKLKAKIWKYLERETIENNLTVLITTHCMNEAAKANYCGFMHRGILIAEDEPKKMIEKFGVETINEVFYQLCLNEPYSVESKMYYTSDDNEKNTQEITKRRIRKQIINGLLIKEFHRFKKSYTDIFLVFIAAFIFTMTCLVVIRYPTDLKLGIVNYDIKNSQQCENQLPNVNSSNQCNQLKFSCEFLKHIDGVEKVFYDSKLKAFEDYKKRKLFGVLVINSNFSNSLLHDEIIAKSFNLLELLCKIFNTTPGYNISTFCKRKFNGTFLQQIILKTESEIEAQNVNIILDYSNYRCSMFMKNKIFDAYLEFMKDLSKKCKISGPLINPFNIEKYPQFNFDPAKSHSPHFTMLITAIIMLSISILSIVQNRLEGVWNRTFFNGASVLEVMIALNIQHFIYAVIISIEIIFSLIYIVEIEIIGEIWISFILLFGHVVNIFLLGFCISLLFDKLYDAAQVGIGIIVFFNFLCGAIWPIEAFSKWISFLFYLFPISLQCIAFPGVIFKNYKIYQTDVLNALGILALHNVLMLFLLYFILKRKKFYSK